VSGDEIENISEEEAGFKDASEDTVKTDEEEIMKQDEAPKNGRTSRKS
jgi:hypothetical protein